MMVPARILRACVEHLLPPPSPRDRAQEQKILAKATRYFARNNRLDLSITKLAAVLGVSPPSFRRLFCDQAHLLAEIMRGHMRAIAVELGSVPETAPGWQARRRAIYRAYTRDTAGTFTEAHHVLVRFRHTLPLDERMPVEGMYHAIGELLAGGLAATALSFMDTSGMGAEQTEFCLAELAEDRGDDPPRVPLWRQRLQEQEREDEARTARAVASLKALAGASEPAQRAGLPDLKTVEAASPGVH